MTNFSSISRASYTDKSHSDDSKRNKPLFANEICEEEAFQAWEKRASSRFEKNKAKATELKRIIKLLMKSLDEAKLDEEKDESGREEEGEEEDVREDGAEAPEAVRINIDDI
jgi:hypothetical protein